MCKFIKLKVIKIVKAISRNNICWLKFCCHCYKYCLHTLVPVLFQSCQSNISSPSISMWIHSKFNYVSELSCTFSNPPSNMDVVYSALCCMLSNAFVWDDASACCVVWPKRAAVQCLRNLFDGCLCICNSL
jgi:hypothetical protein